VPRHRLLLAPTGSRGWFGGRGFETAGPVGIEEGVSLAEAGAALQRAFDAEKPVRLVAVLLTYEGEATVLTYREWRDSGWREAIPPASAPGIAAGAPLIRDPVSAVDARGYRAGVRAVREAVAAGDVYVLNLTYGIRGQAVLPPAETFAALRARAGAEMSAFLDMEDLSIASVSPERFVRVALDPATGMREVEVWPIKGTRPRGVDSASDAALVADLAASEKERAEHVMIVDMERNDLGRVCEAGSVAVDPFLEIVPTPYCHQMVSRVSGVMRLDATIADLLEATFPCGSVTGAPKMAAMRIAAELEGAPRGPYTGALVVARPGELDSSVLIRTAVIEDDKLTWGTGCGITCDSDPVEEWLESLLKASPVTGDGTPPVALREMCRVAEGCVPLLARHLARLAAGGCGPSLLARVRSAITLALADESAGAPAAYGRLAVTVTEGGDVTTELTRWQSSLDVPGGPELVLVGVATAPDLPPGAAKPADRSAWDAALEQAGPSAQAVLIGPDGSVLDGSTASVWLRRDWTLLTSPAPPAVAGIAREVVFDLAQECGLAATESQLTVADLDSAEEVFFTNAVAGVVSARGQEGAAAQRLRSRWVW